MSEARGWIGERTDKHLDTCELKYMEGENPRHCHCRIMLARNRRRGHDPNASASNGFPAQAVSPRVPDPTAQSPLQDKGVTATRVSCNKMP